MVRILIPPLLELAIDLGNKPAISTTTATTMMMILILILPLLQLTIVLGNKPAISTTASTTNSDINTNANPTRAGN